MPDLIRVVLADDHVLVRQGIRQFLEEAADIQVVGEAGDGAEALALVERERPAVAVLDVQMPRMTGVEATREIKSRFPDVRVLVLTAFDDDPYVFALLQAGADGYILKTADADALLDAVRRVAGGQPALSPRVAEKMMRRIRADGPGKSTRPVEPLTPRELDVLRLAAKGLGNIEIGRRLGISSRTVQGHLANVYGRLGVESRTEAVTEALKRGWIVLE